MSYFKIYIITSNYNIINYRALKLLELRNQFDITLICRKAKNENSSRDNVVLIKSSRNYFSIFKKLKLKNISFYLNKRFFFPSPGILYAKNVIRYLKKVINNNKNTRYIIITICPPHDIGIIGYTLKKKFPFIKWLNDLQDLWTPDEYYFNRLTDKNKIKAIKIEKKLFETADKTILTNEISEDFCLRQFHLQKDKLKYIYHPFESFSFKTENNREELIHRIKNKGALQLAFVGVLFKEPKVPGKLLLTELSRFVEIYNWPLTLNLFGSSLPLESKNQKLGRLTINEYQRLSHSDAFKLASESDFLILLLGDVPNAKIIMHGKYPHCLTIGNLILAIVPSGSFIHKSVLKTNSGFFIDINSDLAKSLYDLLISLDRNKLPERNTNEIEKFNLIEFKRAWIELINEFN